MKINGEVTINIELENGKWEFMPQGGIGKSYLCSLLTELSKQGHPIATVTYKEGIVITGNLATAKLIMFDKLDLYADAYNNRKKMEKLGRNAVVLMDVKQCYDNLWGIPVFLEYKDNQINVVM